MEGYTMKTVTIDKKFTKERYNDAVFLVSAIDKEDVRTTLHNVYSNDGFLWATDGHRLHCIPADGIEDGLYTFTKTAKEVVLIPAEDQEVKYPNYEQVFPYGESKTFDFYGGYFVEKVLHYHAIATNDSGSNVSLNANYLKPLMVTDTWKMSVFNPLGPVMFQNCTKTALIMPVRI
jgi:hypothetical protein